MLDVHTPRGQKAQQYELEAAEIFEKWTHLLYVRIANDDASEIDAYGHDHDGALKMCIETKARQMTLDDLRGKFNNTWLVSAAKLQMGRRIAAGLEVPFVGLLYLLPEKIVMMATLSRGRAWIPKVRFERTTTQATINGGTARRLNGFVDMSEAAVLT